MPNIFTPFPEVVRRVLEMGGFSCGVDFKRILKDCATRVMPDHMPQVYQRKV